MATYEWDIETYNDDEIIDHDHRDKLSEFPAEDLLQAINQDQVSLNGEFTRLVLVRTNENGRAWAYITDDGKLPDQMLDAYDRPVCKVPKRFHEEFAR
jgi:hypothetical protein